VITKTYDLILWSCNHTSRFPRSHRFVLGERMERNLYGLLETLIAAKYTKNRQRLLEDARCPSALRIALSTPPGPPFARGGKVSAPRMQRAFAGGRIGFDAIRPRIMSWLGHARHADTYLPSDRAGAKSRSSSRVGDIGCPAE